MSVSSDGFSSDWVSNLNNSISSDPTLANTGSSFDYASLPSSSAFDNTSYNYENGLAGMAAQSPGISNFNINANYPTAGGGGSLLSGAGGILNGIAGLLAGGGSGGSSSLLNSILGIGSGLYGMNLANNLQGMSQAAIAASNPFGPYRAQYAMQLGSVMSNPSQIFNDPGYQAAFNQGDQAVARQMASSGYAGSGNEAIALQQFGQSFANNYLTQREGLLGQLAGANITPNPGPGLAGYGAGINAASSSLGSLGYGASMAAAAAGGGGGAGVSPSPMGNFSSAGGEAATVGAAGQIATAASGLYDNYAHSGTFSGVGNAAGIASGIASGTPTGYAGAAINTGDLAGRAGAFGSHAGLAATGLQDLGAGLSIYQGIRQGGLAGDTQAATGAAQLATNAGYLGGASGALAKAIPYAAIPLAAYNFATQDTKSGATGSDMLGGAEAGAEAGSAFGPVGTVVGGVVGAVAGGVASAFGPGAMDPENVNWDNYAAAFDKNPQSVAGATPGQNFQALTGIFDSRGTTIPFYGKYGRMGENQFMLGMTQQINQAIQSGKIPATASPQQIYQQVVQPWITSMSPNGWQPTNTAKGSPEQGAVGNVLTNLIGQWQNGSLTTQTPVGVNGQTIQGLPAFGFGNPVTPTGSQPWMASPNTSQAGLLAIGRA